ncbi:MAG TPA: MaoC/PaaZ C-terminal domain-containing protein [Xanthomonadales bacterium]|nr:MaoC/PaaZ C-terminal domain-containing protein [Xanthomonadales bacterium]
MKLPAQLEAGDKLPAMHFPPVTRTTLALYCGGSGDHNPIHIDIDYARKAGLDDVIAHGMLVKAYIGRAITAVVEQLSIVQFDTQFLAPTHVGDSITVSLIVGAAGELDGEGLCIIEAEATNQDGVLLARSQVKVGDANFG